MDRFKMTPAVAAERMKDHQYTQLAKTETVEVWRAKKPGSSAYAFELAITPRGMAAYGDIGSLVWEVGSSYGLKFLANSDDDEYVYSKLDHRVREEELDQEHLVEIVYDAILELLEGRDLELTWLGRNTALSERVAELDAWLLGNTALQSEAGEFAALVVALRECQNLEDDSLAGARCWLSDRTGLLEMGSASDYDLGRPSSSVMRDIYMVRHAAQQILAAAEAPTEAATATVEYAYGGREHTEDWSDDGVAAYVSDRELSAGAVIYRGVIRRKKASGYVPDADDIVQHMFDQASSDSEYADNFPDITKDQEAEVDQLMEPVRAWFDRHCDVGFYEVHDIEPYTVTVEDVAAAAAYREQRDHFETPAAVIQQIHDHQELKALVEPSQMEPAQP